MAEEKQPEFEVKDRRRLTPEGDLREGVEETTAAKPSPASAPPPPPPPQPQQQAKPESAASQQASNKYAESAPGYEQITFDRMVLTYAQTAMLQLGLLAEDPAHPPEPDLHGARQTIDVLSMLQEKTRGNLTPEESRLLENSLYELRMAWVEMSRRQKK